jgi:hypothetical protein
MKAFKSGKQRRDELRAARQRRQQRRVELLAASASPAMPAGLATGHVPVDPARLQPNNSYGQPDFLCRGFYQDIAFRCIDCGAECVWAAERQRWWYEVAGGDIYTTARRCAPCRAAERQRKAEAWQRSLEGRLRKLVALAA